MHVNSFPQLGEKTELIQSLALSLGPEGVSGQLVFSLYTVGSVGRLTRRSVPRDRSQGVRPCSRRWQTSLQPSDHSNHGDVIKGIVKGCLKGVNFFEAGADGRKKFLKSM